MTNTLRRLVLLTPVAISLPASSNGGEMVVPSGSVLRSRLEDTVRMKPGAPVSVVLSEPLYGRDARLPARHGSEGAYHLSQLAPVC
jgi:hypothetical protein